MTRLNEKLQVGPVTLRNRVIAAPLSGVSDLPFRQRTWDGGAGLVVSEMIASREFCTTSKESAKRALCENNGPKMLQLAGREAHWMGEAARIAEDGGADIIDINMGCPARKVTGGVSGSALMRDLDHAMTLVEATVKAVKLPVTLKMRLGWDEESINAPELARRAVDAGVQMITVHGRTRCQFYEGSADWNAIAAVRDVINVPLVVNGDIVDLASAEKAMMLSGADAVMVGRIAYGAPWMVGDLVRAAAGEAPLLESGIDLSAYIISHYHDMLALYGERVGIRHARKHLGWYMDRHAPFVDGETRQKIMQSHDPIKVEELLVALFEGNSTTQIVRDIANQEAA